MTQGKYILAIVANQGQQQLFPQTSRPHEDLGALWSLSYIFMADTEAYISFEMFRKYIATFFSPQNKNVTFSQRDYKV